MPGRKGMKLIPRKSKSGHFTSVKALVFTLLEKHPNITKDEVDNIVMKEYPKSNFAKKNGRSHFPWYKHQFKKMKLEEAGFNVRDSKEKKDETAADARKEDDNGKTRTAHTNGMGKKDHRAKGRRDAVHQTAKRKVDVKARKSRAQHGKSAGTDRKETEVAQPK